MKKTAILLILTVFMSMFSAFAADEITKVSYICEGVELITTEYTGSGGTSSVTVVRADLSYPNLELKNMFSDEGTNILSTVEELAGENNAAAAINADFFAWGAEGGTGSAIGYNVDDGVLITTPCADEEVAAVAFNENGEVLFDYFKADITLTLPSGETQYIKHINKYTDLTELCIFTDEWGKTSIGSGGTQFEIVVKNNIVTEILTGGDPAQIPSDGYVIAGLSDWSDNFQEKVNIGDTLKFSMNITPDFPADIVVGGGTLLVKDGKSAPITHNISGKNPRSAFGTDKSGKIVYLIAVDGRGANGSAGMTLSELSQFMIDIGVYNGINFDGGGSTQLVVDDEYGRYMANNPSQTPYRKVINALGIINTAKQPEPEGVVKDGFEGTNAKNYAYPSDVKTAYKVTDEMSKNGVRSGKLWFDFTQESENLMSAGFTFNTPKTITEKGSVLSVQAYAEKPNYQWLRFMVTDADGELHRLTLSESVDWAGWRYLAVKIPSEVKLPAKLTRIYVVQPDKDEKSDGIMYFDNLVIDPSLEPVEYEPIPRPKPEPEENIPQTPTEQDKPELQGEYKMVITAGLKPENTFINRLSNLRLSRELQRHKNYINLSEITRNERVDVEGISFLKIHDVSSASLLSHAEWLINQLETVENEAVILANGDFSDAYVDMIKQISADFNDIKVTAVCISPKQKETIEGGVTFVRLNNIKPSVTAEIKALPFMCVETAYKVHSFEIW